jgi:hypothetical protein
MAASKFMIFIHRTVAVLGFLMLGGMTVRMFYLHDYVWAWVYVALIAWVLYWFIKSLFSAKPNYMGYNIVLCGLWPCWNEYSHYKNEVRIEKYSLVYNKTRERLGIPVIPVDWHIEYQGSLSADWRGKKGVLGHEEKYIGFDSLQKIEFERDEYNFKGVRDTSRSISILFKYARGNSKDSIFYFFDYPLDKRDTTVNISRHQADSIFDAAGIKKDY